MSYMKKAQTLLILAVWTAILPYLGFPYFWKNILFTITGLILAYFSYLLYKEAKKQRTPTERKIDTFSENSLPQEEKIVENTPDQSES